MTVRERIALLVEAQGASKAKRDIEGVGKATGKLSGETAKSGKRMTVARGAASALGNSIRGLARWAKYGAIAVGGLALVLGKRSIEEWREAGRVNRVTAARIRSTGKAAGLSADDIGDMSTSLSNLVGIDDEEIQNTANRLLTFTAIDKDLFKPALQSAIDMGAEFGNSGSAATQLGKALQDPVKGATALRRMGVNLNEQQQEQINTWVEQGKTIKAQRWILKELRTEFGGTAKAQTDGLQRMAVSWKNVEESIGGVFGPGLDFAGNRFADFADKKMIPVIDSIAAEMRTIWDPKADDDLEERLARTGNVIRTKLGPAWDELKRDIDAADIDDKLLQVISDATPRIAETMGKGGGRAAWAFVKGVAKAPAWAQVLTLTFFMGKFGMLGPLGKWAGKKFLEKFAPELAARLLAAQAVDGTIGVAAAGSKSKWKGLGGKAGKLFGVAFAAAAILFFKDDIEAALEDIAPGPNATDPTDGEAQRRADERAGRQGGSWMDPRPGVDSWHWGPNPPKLKAPPKLKQGGASSLRDIERDIVIPLEVEGRELGRAVRRVSLREFLAASPD